MRRSSKWIGVGIAIGVALDASRLDRYIILFSAMGARNVQRLDAAPPSSRLIAAQPQTAGIDSPSTTYWLPVT